MAQTPINSIVNLNIPAAVPEAFQDDPRIKAAVELFLTSFNNMLTQFEQYVAPTQKHVSLWNSITPSETILRSFAGRLYVTAGEALNSGDFVNLYNNAGVLNVRKANATAGTVRPAYGYCSTSGGILLGGRGEIILAQGLLSITGVVPGDLLFLSTSAGQATLTPPTAAGQLEQFLGVGLANNLAYIDITMGQYIQH